MLAHSAHARIQNHRGQVFVSWLQGHAQILIRNVGIGVKHGFAVGGKLAFEGVAEQGLIGLRAHNADGGIGLIVAKLVFLRQFQGRREKR